MYSFIKKCDFVNDGRKQVRAFISRSGFQDEVLKDSLSKDVIKLDIWILKI